MSETEVATFKCGWCDRTFDTKQGLAMHRSRVHRSNGASREKEIHLDRLVKEVFPNGVPAKASTIERLGAWLAEARELRAES